MIIYLSIAILILLIIIGTYLSIWYCRLKRINKNKISFFETLNLTGLPVITMESNKEKINFLLDTGSNASFIDINIVQKLESNKLESGNQFVTGINNKECKTESYDVSLKYKDNKFSSEFKAFDFNASFGHIMSKTGVKIDGIIGGDFLKKYKYIINYDEFVAYNL